MNGQNKKPLQVIGPTALVEVDEIKNIPAKIDTGADSSSIWASHITIDPQNILHFTLFDESSPLYTGKIYSTSKYRAASVRSSNGQKQIRYQVRLPVSIDGRHIRATFSLSDRGRNKYPILIGKRTLHGKFIVDVSKPSIRLSRRKTHSLKLTKELIKNPYQFHQKYVKSNLRGTEK